MIRMTRQRRAILDAFGRVGRPLSPKEVVEEAGRDVDNINLATVYRNLKALVENGELIAVEVVGQPPRYEPTGLAHHHHFLCESCDRVYDLPGCAGTFDRLAPKGSTVADHALMLTGSCDECG